jgi:hypothetical protein
VTREDTIKNNIISAVLSEKAHLANCTVFFFGSRVSGSHKDRSDFDVGIISNNDVAIKTFYQLEDKLDSIITLYKIDLVDFSSVSDGFRKEAMKNMEVIVG